MNLSIDPRATDAELTKVIKAANAQITDYRKTLAQLEQIRDLAKLALLGRELADAERE